MQAWGVTQSIYTAFRRRLDIRKQGWEIVNGANDEIVATPANDFQVPGRELRYDILQILSGSQSPRQSAETKQSECWKLVATAPALCVAVMHNKDSWVYPQMRSGIAYRQVVRKIVGCMTITKKVRIETDNHRIVRRSYGRHFITDTFQLGLKLTD